jgi:cytochrome c
MPTSKRFIALIAGALAIAAGCKGGGGGGGGGDAGEGGATQANDSGGPGGTRIGTSGARIAAGGVLPAANALSAKRPDKPDATAGGNLFAAMNCDGCHGGGAIGWVGPSLVDGRWRYGGSDEEIFTSIYYGRPKGMPAYGGVVGTDGVWSLVAYIKAQAKPPVVPTTSWLPGGNATATPPAPTPPSAASEEKASPSGAEQAKSDSSKGESSKSDSGQAEPAKDTAKQVSVKPEEMPAKYGCTACHAVDHKVVGPAFKDVAARYKGQDVEAKLVEKVRNGGAGVWGQVPMTPNPQVPEQDLHAVVKWVLSLK